MLQFCCGCISLLQWRHYKNLKSEKKYFYIFRKKKSPAVFMIAFASTHNRQDNGLREIKVLKFKLEFEIQKLNNELKIEKK